MILLSFVWKQLTSYEKECLFSEPKDFSVNIAKKKFVMLFVVEHLCSSAYWTERQKIDSLTSLIEANAILGMNIDV